jgi:hypothetical protein
VGTKSQSGSAGVLSKSPFAIDEAATGPVYSALKSPAVFADKTNSGARK